MFSSLFAQVQVVPVAKHNIPYKSMIKRSDIYLVEVDKKYKCKEYINVDDLIQGLYRTKHYILKNKKICKNDLYIIENNKVKFKFGLIEVETDAQLVEENEKYIKIRDKHGQIEKIYKSGNR